MTGDEVVKPLPRDRWKEAVDLARRERIDEHDERIDATKLPRGDRDLEPYVGRCIERQRDHPLPRRRVHLAHLARSAHRPCAKGRVGGKQEVAVELGGKWAHADEGPKTVKPRASVGVRIAHEALEGIARARRPALGEHALGTLAK